MRVLITGADGQLGLELQQALKSETLIPLVWPAFDLLKPDADAQILAPRQAFDLVLADPPFALRDPLPPALLQPGALAADGLLVLEQPGERIAPLRLGALELRESRPYGGTSSLWIYAPSVAG